MALRWASSAHPGSKVAILLPVLGLVALTLVWPGDLPHHALETLIGVFHRH